MADLKSVNEKADKDGTVIQGLLQELETRLNDEIARREILEEQVSELEGKLSSIFHVEPVWVNICSLDGRIEAANPTGIELMEADSEEQLVGRYLRDFVTDSFLEDSQFKQACATHFPEQTEVELQTLKGNTRWVSINGIEIRNHQGEPTQLMSIVCDQTARKKAQDEALIRLQELAQVERLNTLGEMGLGLAHELNQPLSAIQNYVSGCERRMKNSACADADLINTMQHVKTQISRASETLNHIRNFIRREEYAQQPIDLNKIICDAILLSKMITRNNTANIETNLSQDLSPVTANRVQVEQLLVNLIVNALEAMEEGKTKDPRLDISSTVVGDDEVLVRVRDNGPGLPEGFETFLFKPFSTAKVHGLGMGLLISRSIVESHGGTLHAKNNFSGGATFSFTLSL